MKELPIVHHAPIVEHAMMDPFGTICTHRASSSGVEGWQFFTSLRDELMALGAGGGISGELWDFPGTQIIEGAGELIRLPVCQLEDDDTSGRNLNDRLAQTSLCSSGHGDTHHRICLVDCW